MGVVRQGFYCKPQPKLVHGGGQPGVILYTLAKTGSLGWSARVLIRVALDTELARYPAIFFTGYLAKYPLKENRVYCWLDFGGYIVMFLIAF